MAPPVTPSPPSGDYLGRYSLYFLLTYVTQTATYVHLMSRGETIRLSVGESVPLACEFYTAYFNLFDNPILWRKTQLHEDTQINMMGNLMEPFASEGRFKVTFVEENPRHKLTLTISNITYEDIGNYTCEINGPQNTLLGSVTYVILIRAPLELMTIHGFNTTAHDEYLPPGNQTGQGLFYTENVPGHLCCAVSGQFPPSSISVAVGTLNLTESLVFVQTARIVGGDRGMRLIRFITARWSRRFQARAEDDGLMVRCTTTSPGAASNLSQAKLIVNFAPIINCYSNTAYLGERNSVLRCEIKARPGLNALYWMLSQNGTIISQGQQPFNGEYQTVVKDRSDGLLETQLHIRQIRQDNFRVYTVIAENSVAVRWQHVTLTQKEHRSTVTSWEYITPGNYPLRRGIVQGHRSADQKDFLLQTNDCNLLTSNFTRLTLTLCFSSLLYLYTSVILCD